ncbi:hypothetical protein ACFJIY_07520 [Pimelobacter simplex]|uniref:hypothetical protein n=1 Tax=Nocardioides simplex TaxID=2045 RepID=UPI0036703359
MTGREWQPGDVANTLNHGGTQLAFRTSSGWTFIDGSASGECADDYGFRHVVVIDPEDREQVERLESLYLSDEHRECDDTTGCMQEALRGLASPTPPKPDEPSGLGAVVEAVCGCDVGPQKFIHDPLSTRFEGRPLVPGRTWKSACGHHAWSVLQEVKVLNDGYKPGEPSC